MVGRRRWTGCRTSSTRCCTWPSRRRGRRRTPCSTRCKNPLNPLHHTSFGRNVAASAELFERMTRRYGKPLFGLDTTTLSTASRSRSSRRLSGAAPSAACCISSAQFEGAAPRQSKLLIVAPMSGHYATLLRGTVEAFLPSHDVYITDWGDARTVPLVDGPSTSTTTSIISMRSCASWRRDGDARCIRSASVRPRCR